MKFISFLFFSIFFFNFSIAQDIGIQQKVFTDLEEASKNPENVFNLDLSNTKLNSFPTEIFKFKNLQTLNLKNDHFKEIPREISTLKNLRILDLSGNDFIVLPESIKELNNLQELYLNEIKNQNLEADFKILRKLPNLRILHLEHDGISVLPKNINKLKHLEKLYLNENDFTEFPSYLGKNKHLIFLDMKSNPMQWKGERPFGITVNF